MKKRNQADAVLEYMRTHRGISSYDAFEKLYVTRLSAVIFKLREAGHTIITVNIPDGTNSYGNPSYHAEYRLVGGGQ